MFAVFSVFGRCRVTKSARAEQLVEILDPLDPERQRPLGRQERVVGDHLHLQPDGARRHHRADVAAADEPQRLAGDLDPHEPRLLPLAGPGRGVRRRDLPRHREHHGDGVLGGGDRVAEGRVHHHDALGAEAAGMSTLSTPIPARPITRRLPALAISSARHLGGRADREAVVAADDLGQPRRVAAELRLEVDLDAAVAEDLHGGVGKLIGNKNLGHGYVILVAGPGPPVSRGTRGQAAAFVAAKAQSSHGSAPRRRRCRRWCRTRCAGPAARRGGRRCRRRRPRPRGAWSSA